MPEQPKFILQRFFHGAGRCLLLLAALISSMPLMASESVTFEVLCYHDVRDDVLGDLDEDPFALSTDHLIRHFNWLQGQGYTVISIDDVLAARSGKRALPDKAVLLSFDDGYRSFYQRVFPLLRLYDFPAVFALVGSWIEAPQGSEVDYGSRRLPRSDFLSEAQIREMADSGLVEFASHSYDLHRGVLANPQGNLMPAMVTREYRSDSGYEPEADYLSRIRNDLRRNSELLQALTGKSPRVMVWPYGSYNAEAEEIAAELGMHVGLTLDQDSPDAGRPGRISRLLIEANINEQGLAELMQRHPAVVGDRIAHIDLDYLYDADPVQQAKNLDLLLDRIRAMQIRTVYLQAFSDPDGDGNASAVYFPNRHVPVRADLFSRVAWQLRTRARVRVFAWMPVLSFDLPDKALQNRLRVRSGEQAQLDDGPGVYRRLSPFSPEARTIIREIYTDLGRYTAFDGLLFHDDLLLTDFEDTSDAAMQVYRQQWSLPGDLKELRADVRMLDKWARLKTRYLIDFSLALAETVRRSRPQIKTARNLYARVVMQPHSEQWLAQNLEQFLGAYDYTAVMAMPYMEQASDPEQWLQNLFARIAQVPGALEKTVFELQARDWHRGEAIPDQVLSAQLRSLVRSGARHIAYYPDDFINNQPALDIIRPVISISDYPYLPQRLTVAGEDTRLLDSQSGYRE